MSTALQMDNITRVSVTVNLYIEHHHLFNYINNLYRSNGMTRVMGGITEYKLFWIRTVVHYPYYKPIARIGTNYTTKIFFKLSSLSSRPYIGIHEQYCLIINQVKIWLNNLGDISARKPLDNNWENLFLFRLSTT